MPLLAGQKVTAALLNKAMYPPRCHAYQTATQNIPDATSTAITMNAESLDTHGNHSLVTNTSRFTATVAGTYRCYGQVAYAGNLTGDRGAQFKKNGAGVDTLPYGGSPAMNGTGLLAGIARTGGTVALAVGDYVELYGIHSAGVTVATFYFANGTNSFWIIEWIHD